MGLGDATILSSTKSLAQDFPNLTIGECRRGLADLLEKCGQHGKDLSTESCKGLINLVLSIATPRITSQDSALQWPCFQLLMFAARAGRCDEDSTILTDLHNFFFKLAKKEVKTQPCWKPRVMILFLQHTFRWMQCAGMSKVVKDSSFKFDVVTSYMEALYGELAKPTTRWTPRWRYKAEASLEGIFGANEKVVEAALAWAKKSDVMPGILIAALAREVLKKADSPSRSTLVELYQKHVLEAKVAPPTRSLEGWAPVVAAITAEEFSKTLLPLAVRMSKRQPAAVSQYFPYLILHSKFDYSSCAKEALEPMGLDLLKDKEKRGKGIRLVQDVALKSSDASTVVALAEAWADQAKKAGKTDEKHALLLGLNGLLTALLEKKDAAGLEGLSKLADPKGSLVKLSHEDANEDTRVFGYTAIGTLLMLLPDAGAQANLVPELSKPFTDKKAPDRTRLAVLTRFAEFTPTACVKGGAAPAWLGGLLDKVVPLLSLAATKPVHRIQSLLAWATCGAASVCEDETLGGRLKKEQTSLLKDASTFLNTPDLIMKASSTEAVAQGQCWSAVLTGRLTATLATITAAGKSFVEEGKLSSLPAGKVSEAPPAAGSTLLLLASLHSAVEATPETGKSGLGAPFGALPRVPVEVLGLEGAMASLPEADGDLLLCALVRLFSSWLAELSTKPSAVAGPVKSSALRGVLMDLAAAAAASKSKPRPEVLSLLAVCAHHPLLTSKKFKTHHVWSDLYKKCFGSLVEQAGQSFWASLLKLVRSGRTMPESETTGFRVAACRVLSILSDAEVSQVEGEVEKLLQDCSTYFHSEEIGKETDWNIAVYFAPEGRLHIEEGTYIAEEREDKNVKKNKFLKDLYDDDLALETAPTRPKPVDKKAAGKAKGKAKAKAAPDGGNMTASDIEAAKIQEQSETRERIRCLVAEANFSLEILSVVSKVSKLTELIEEAVPHLMGHFMTLLTSPLTVLKARRCLRSVVLAVVEEEVLIQRRLIPEALTVAGKGWLQRDPAACGTGGAEPIAEVVLESLEIKEVLPAPTFALVLPLLLRVLRDSCFPLQKVCARALQVLEQQLELGAKVPAAKVPDVFDALSVPLLTLPPIRPAVQAAMSAAAQHLIASEEQLRRVADMFYAEEDLVRSAVISALAHLQENKNFQAGDFDALGCRAVLRLGALDEGSKDLARETLDALELGPDADLPIELVVIASSKANLTKDVQVLIAQACAEVLDELDDASTSQRTLDELMARFAETPEARVPLARVMESVFGGTLQTEELVVKALRFLLRVALAHCSNEAAGFELRAILLAVGCALVEKHGENYADALFEAVAEFEDSPLGQQAGESAKLGVAVYLGALSGRLGADKQHGREIDILPRLLQRLLDPESTASVQDQIVKVIYPIMKQNKEQANETLKELLDIALAAKTPAMRRRGAAMGIGPTVRGLSIQAFAQHKIMDRIQEACKAKDHEVREGALLCLEGLAQGLGRLFEPYAATSTPMLLAAFSDSKPSVQATSKSAAKVMMAQLSGPGVKQVLPAMLNGIQDKQWRTKLGSIELLAAMTNCMPKHLNTCLPQVVPALCTVINDQHNKVKEAAREALDQVGKIITNPELKAIAEELINALIEGAQYEQITKEVLDQLLSTSFVHHVDAPSLSLVCPLVQRALKGSSAEMKRKGAQLVGSMVILIRDPKDIQPYLPSLLPQLKDRLMDPVPDVRATVAKAFGTLAKGLPENMLGDSLQWMFEMLCSSGDVERNGAAHGLSEMLMAMGTSRIEGLLPDIMAHASNRDPNVKVEVKDGYLGLFVYLPVAMGAAFEPHLEETLSILLRSQADEASTVRDTAMKAGQVLVRHFGASHTGVLLQPLDECIFDADWHIRHASVILIGQLVEQILRAHRLPTQSAELMFCEQLPRAWRCHVLSSLYVIRSDENSVVRQCCAQVWKQIVQNTPRTLKELLPALMERLIGSLASPNKEKQRVAARCVGDLVGKLGERVMPELMPIFMNTLSTGDAHVREGVCIGLAELINATTKELLSAYLDDLIPAIQQAIIDDAEDVRSSAGLVVALLHTSVGPRATQEIVSWVLGELLHEQNEEHGELFLNGLEQLVTKQSGAVLPLMLKQLTKEPEQGWTIMQVQGLSVLSVVNDGHTIHRHLSDVLPVMVSAGSSDNEELQEAALEAAGRLTDRVEQGGLHLLSDELVKAISDPSDPAKRAFGARLTDRFFTATKLDTVPTLQDILRAILPVALDDEDPDALAMGMVALNSIVNKVSKEVLSSYLSDIRTTILALIYKPGTQTVDEDKLLPGLCDHKGLEPLYPIYQQGLMHGSAETRELAAKGLGELVDHTTEAALKPFVVKITGPLLRIVGDRFPGSVKRAIVDTLRALLIRGGPSLRPFLPQLQTTYMKCLSDPTEAVRSRAGESLGILVRIAPRTEPLINELTKEAGTNADGPVRISMCQALAEVLINLPAKASDAAQDKIVETLESKTMGDDTETQDRVATARPLGLALRLHLREEKREELLQSLQDALGGDEAARHGAALTLANACSAGKVELPAMEDDLREAILKVAAPAVKKLAQDSDPECRAAAKKLGEAVEALQKGS